jgi:hypothetical protein
LDGTNFDWLPNLAADFAKKSKKILNWRWDIMRFPGSGLSRRLISEARDQITRRASVNSFS